MPEYTAEQLKEIYGDNYLNLLPNNVVIPEPDKPIIYSFTDLDNDSKVIYNSLYNLIANKNIGYGGMVLFVTGKRVVGKWRSNEEASQINQEYNLNIQADPYEFCTNAPTLPTYEELRNISPMHELNINCSNETHSIIVPPPQ